MEGIAWEFLRRQRAYRNAYDVYRTAPAVLRTLDPSRAFELCEFDGVDRRLAALLPKLDSVLMAWFDAEPIPRTGETFGTWRARAKHGGQFKLSRKIASPRKFGLVKYHDPTVPIPRGRRIFVPLSRALTPLAKPSGNGKEQIDVGARRPNDDTEVMITFDVRKDLTGQLHAAQSILESHRKRLNRRPRGRRPRRLKAGKVVSQARAPRLYDRRDLKVDRYLFRHYWRLLDAEEAGAVADVKIDTLQQHASSDRLKRLKQMLKAAEKRQADYLHIVYGHLPQKTAGGTTTRIKAHGENKTA
jgi:hypothetical protein